jgi:SAM-dependent methyltransferase
LTADLAPVESFYGDDYFFGGGVGYPDYLAERELLIEHGRRYGRILQQHVRPGRVLDVGAAAGFILRGLADYGWEPQGLEPNARLAEYGRQQFGFEITVGTLETTPIHAVFDLVTMIQVVGHFRSLSQAFDAAAAITRPEGYWLIETWNHCSLTARLLGKHWHEWSPPSVLHWFSPQSLVTLANRYGFHEVARGRPKKQLNGEHAKSLLRYKLAASRVGRSLCRLLELTVPDRLTIAYPAEDLFWILLQKRSTQA